MAKSRVRRRGGQSARCRGERAAVLVEFALTLPLLMMLILGMFSGGLAYNQKQEMTHAVREGARYAATVPLSTTFTNGGTWQDNIRDLIVERSNGDLTGAQVCVSLVNGSGGSLTVLRTTAAGGAACIPGQAYPISGTDDGRRVQVTATRPALIELGLFGKFTVTLSTDATAKSESSS